MSSNKLRVLCCHSFRTNAEAFRMMLTMAGFTKRYDDILDLVFVDAPHVATPEEEERVEPAVKAMFEGPYRQWWTASSDGSTYEGWNQSVGHVRAFMQQHGPFDGVLGFSQGGCLAGLLPLLQLRGDYGLDKLPKLRFAVIMSGFRVRDAELLSCYDLTPSGISAMLITGGKDRAVPSERTLKLQEVYCDPPAVVVIEPDGGHKVNRFDEDNARIVRSFFEQQLRAKPSL